MRILLAEDNPTNEAVARQLLSRLGHTISVAHNGCEVLEILERGERFDCILMDIQMPEMDGIEAARRVRTDMPADVACTPIMAVTANAFESNRAACFAVGMVDFLTKPLRLSVLEEALAALGRGGGRTERPQSGADAIDFEQFDSIIDGGDAEALEIFEDFCTATVELLSGMSAADGAGAVARAAHQLKGSLATFGLAGLSERMGAVEELAGEDKLDGLELGWDGVLERDFLTAVGALRERIGVGGGGGVQRDPAVASRPSGVC